MCRALCDDVTSGLFSGIALQYDKRVNSIYACMDEQPKALQWSLTQDALGKPIPKYLMLTLEKKSFITDILLEYYTLNNCKNIRF